jgi:hypothetical protein
MKMRYLALFALAPALSQCQPACAPPPAGPAPTTTAEPTTTTAPVTYLWDVGGFCDDDGVGIEITNTGTGVLWIEGDTQATPPGDAVDLFWPADPDDPTLPAETMDVTYHADTATGAVLATETYDFAAVCGP